MSDAKKSQTGDSTDTADAPVATATPVGDPVKSARDAEHERQVEYGTYVATEQIYVGNALAFRKGEPVPKSHVERGVVPAALVSKKES